jgi:hypothetical protein
MVLEQAFPQFHTCRFSRSGPILKSVYDFKDEDLAWINSGCIRDLFDCRHCASLSVRSLVGQFCLGTPSGLEVFDGASGSSVNASSGQLEIDSTGSLPAYVVANAAAFRALFHNSERQSWHGHLGF